MLQGTFREYSLQVMGFICVPFYNHLVKLNLHRFFLFELQITGNYIETQTISYSVFVLYLNAILCVCRGILHTYYHIWSSSTAATTTIV